jgi:N-acetylglutamate synthase-like GNAT family acetyltransferase
MSSPAIIRRARASDAATISSLIQQHVATGTLLPRLPEFIAEHAIDFLVATVDGQVVGCVHLEEYSPSLAEVRSIVVESPYQRRGVGVALVNAIEGLARTREYRTLFAVSNNDGFFRSRGYGPREIPELSRERSEVTRFKGVYAKDLAASGAGPASGHTP